MIKHQIIDNQIESIRDLIANADFKISTLEQFYKDLSAEELLLFDKYELLQFIKINLWNSSILDLCKLFIPKEDFSLFKLLKTSIDKFHLIKFQGIISINDLSQLIDRIDPFQDRIIKVKKIRDKYIAHKDNKVEFNSLMLYELRSLIDLAQAIFNKIYSGLYDSEFIWDFKHDKQELSMIENLAKYELIRKTIFQADISNKKEIRTSEIAAILMSRK
jgi:hypothetical protein